MEKKKVVESQTAESNYSCIIALWVVAAILGFLVWSFLIYHFDGDIGRTIDCVNKGLWRCI